MAHESDRRRKLILSTIGGLAVQARVFSVDLRARSERAARDIALAAATRAMIDDRVGHLIVESCDQDRPDRQVISRVLQAGPNVRRLPYQHADAYAEPLLWLPDILAWSYGRGGEWRRRAERLIVSAIELRGG